MSADRPAVLLQEAAFKGMKPATDDNDELAVMLRQILQRLADGQYGRLLRRQDWEHERNESQTTGADHDGHSLATVDRKVNVISGSYAGTIRLERRRQIVHPTRESVAAPLRTAAKIVYRHSES